MAKFKALKHTWIFPESTSFVNSPFILYVSATNISPGAEDPKGVYWNGTTFYVVDWVVDEVYQWNSDFTVKTDTFAYAGGQAWGITNDGTYWYVGDHTNSQVYKYNSAWVYQSTIDIDTLSGGLNTMPTGMYWDDTSFFVLDTDGNIYRYNSAWVYQDAVDIGALGMANCNPTGIANDGTYHYIADNFNSVIYRFTSAFVLVATFDVGALGGNDDVEGLEYVDGYLYATDGDGFVYKYNIDFLDSLSGHIDSIRIYNGMYEDFASAYMTGIIECYLYSKDVTDEVAIILKDGSAAECIKVEIDTSKIIGDGTDALDPAVNFTFYHIKINFNCYSNTYDLYVDSVLQLDDQAFGNNDDGSGITRIYLSAATDENGYIDAIGVLEGNGLFVGTYSFTADANGAEPADWTSANGAGCTTTVIAEFNNHAKVLQVYDNNGATLPDIQQAFGVAKVTGGVEFHMGSSDAAKLTRIYFSDLVGADWYTNCFVLLIEDDKFQYYDGSNHDVGLVALDNTWYHIRITWDCTDVWHLWINGTLYSGAGYGFRNNPAAIDLIKIYGSNADSGYYGYWDAFDYSWSTGYTVGRNIPEGMTGVDSYEEGDNLVDTEDITANITYAKITEPLYITSNAEVKIKADTISEFEPGHEIDFYDQFDVLSWVGRILVPTKTKTGTVVTGSMKLIGIDSKFENTYRKKYTTLRDSDYVIKDIIDSFLTRYHSYDDEIDNFTITYLYDLKKKVWKMFYYLAMLERAIIHYKPNGEIFFNKYDNITKTGKSWVNGTTESVKIVQNTADANRFVTRAPVIGAVNTKGQIYVTGVSTDQVADEIQYGINELQNWRDGEITNYTEASQLAGNLQTIFSQDTQFVKILCVDQGHIQVGYSVELLSTDVFVIALTDLNVLKRVWYPHLDLTELEVSDNILTDSDFWTKVSQKFYDEESQASNEDSEIAESTVDGTVMVLNSISQLRAKAPITNVAAVAPTVNDDEDDGYRAGDMWLDTVAKVLYVLIDATATAADWDAI